MLSNYCCFKSIAYFNCYSFRSDYLSLWVEWVLSYLNFSPSLNSIVSPKISSMLLCLRLKCLFKEIEIPYIKSAEFSWSYPFWILAFRISLSKYFRRWKLLPIQARHKLSKINRRNLLYSCVLSIVKRTWKSLLIHVNYFPIICKRLV